MLNSRTLKGAARRRGSQGRVFATENEGIHRGSFGQARFAKTLNPQLRICLRVPAPSEI
jgi:hypothetical protein